MNPIDEAFARLRDQKKKAFIPFIGAGDPDLASTEKLIVELARQGATIIEIGFPYSDPIADGPVIQASYTRALSKGMKIDGLFTAVKNAKAILDKEGLKTPLVGMVAASIIHRFGREKFIKACLESGFSGLIVPDLPAEESISLAKDLGEKSLAIIQLITPNTPQDRAKMILANCTGFVYCVSVSGITGERDSLPEKLLENLRWLKQQTKLPLCVGFGISKPHHATLLRDHADGIIVGSAVVRHLENVSSIGMDTAIKNISSLSQSLLNALNP